MEQINLLLKIKRLMAGSMITFHYGLTKTDGLTDEGEFIGPVGGSKKLKFGERPASIFEG